jgi:hypothetical protein
MKCPKCNAISVAKIFWGFPGDYASVEEQVERKEIVMGGCLVTDNDPEWECNVCHHRWGIRE